MNLIEYVLDFIITVPENNKNLTRNKNDNRKK
jgi:hypothetical protein